jgi:predicted dehydrogenase
MDILSEKPIADTMEGSVRIARKVRAANRKMAVTMSHRFDQDKSTLRTLVFSNKIGKVNTISCRFAGDLRLFDSWRRFRHEMVHPMLIEGAVHHLDIIADLAGAPCTSIFARTWKPAWAEYAGDTDVIAVLDFANGAHGVYEASCAHATGLNDWSFEYFRVDAEFGSAILDHRDLEVFRRDDAKRRQTSRHGRGETVPMLQSAKWTHSLMIEQFCKWIDGGPEMATNVEVNLRSVALVFAAIESVERGTPVSMEDYLRSFS